MLTGLLFSWFTNPLLVLGLALFAVVTLRRTGRVAGPLSEADRRWRMAALVAAGVWVAGFGVCGGGGTVIGLGTLFTGGAQGQGYGVLFLVPGLLGLALAGLGVWVIRKYRRPDGAASGGGASSPASPSQDDERRAGPGG